MTKTLEDYRKAFDDKAHFCYTTNHHYTKEDKYEYQVGIHNEKMGAPSHTPSKEQVEEVTTFMKANGLGAKDYKLYSGLIYNFTLEQCVEYFLDRKKPLHPVIYDKTYGKT
tara:strand:+ start:1952 stop:2284 length:333 start_codon:yes stop_codon:yes gene_type:complete